MIASSVFGIREAWPLREQARRLDVGHVLNCAVTDCLRPEIAGALQAHHAGLFECKLDDGSLIWSGGAYDLFGLERGTSITRGQAVRHYLEDSQAALERLRAHAIRFEQGFTLDAEIRAAAVGEVRRIRVIAVPLFENGTAVSLHGVKIPIS